MNVTTSLLTISKLSCSFDGVQALSEISFSIQPHIITALIGPNGAGKTTVLNTISGFLRPDTGCITFAGKEITRSRPDEIARLGIGRTFQDCKIFPQLTVLDNVILGFKDPENETLAVALLRMKSMISSECNKLKHAYALLDQVGLFSKKDYWAGNLSYGQRKLLELCRVQALNPILVLLDEPMAGLFPAMVIKMMAMIHRLRNTGMTVVFIEHNMKVVMELSDHILVLSSGKLIADNSPAMILNDPAVQEAYLGKKVSNAS